MSDMSESLAAPESGAAGDVEREIELLREFLGDEFAPVLRGPALAKALGLTLQALKFQVRRGSCPVRGVRSEGRRGCAAHVEEVAGYLASLRRPSGSER